MTLFFITVFSVYGGIHLYVFLRARATFGFGPWTAAIVGVIMLLMIFGIVFVRAFENRGYETAARTTAYVAYFWMAAIFLLFCVCAFFDVIGLTTRAAGSLLHADVSNFLLSSRTSFAISLLLAVSICAYGYFEDRSIRTENVRIETDKLPTGTDRVTIAQLSDVHLGLIIRKERLARMLDVVKEAKPDIFISTGDLVDAQLNHLTGLADLLLGIKTKYGNYAITGNHEYYAGIRTALLFTKNAGFTVLQNKTVNAGPIYIAGVNDRTAVQLRLEKPISESEMLAKIPRDRFVLFLKHQPRIDPSTIGLFDLQLSGHTHKGQIFPFTYITRAVFPLNSGTYDLGKGSILHVSRGSGSWGPPIRFLAPPEVTIIELVRKTGNKS